MLDDIISGFENAIRYGAEKDEPEGQRYIKISEPLVEKIIVLLKDINDIFDIINKAKERWEDERPKDVAGLLAAVDVWLSVCGED